MNLIILPDKYSVGKYIASDISDIIVQNPYAVLGLATGSSPKTTYNYLVELHDKGLDFSNITTFNLDEYVGIQMDMTKSPVEDQSYARFMHEKLFRYINISQANQHIPDGMIPLESMDAHCFQYEEDIAASGGIDYQIMGLGPDGHVGFCMPPADCMSRTHLATLSKATLDANWESFYINSGKNRSEMPTQAITMGIGTMLEYCFDMTMIVLGENKARILKEVVESDLDPSIPATYLKISPRFKIVADEGAAKLIKDADFYRNLLQKRIDFGFERDTNRFNDIEYQ